jgi:glycosyltransferase involved in cell wall biosynthesis
VSTGPSTSKASRPGPYRLIIISDTYPPVVGGAEMDAQRVSAGLIARGHQVRVICAGGGPMPPQGPWVDGAGVPVEILTNSHASRWDHVRFALRVALTLWHRRREYDVAFFSMSGLHLATGLPVSRWLGKTILTKVHGSTVIPTMERSPLGRMELRWMARWASRVMVLNDEMVAEALAAGIPQSKILHMPNPIDTETFAPVSPEERLEIRQRLGIPQSARVLLYTGRLSKEKGLTWLIESFAAVSPQVPDTQLILLGDGPIRKDLEELALRLGMGEDRIRFAGRVPSTEVAPWLQAADAFALVSPAEGFSCALAEAMSTGLPAVVSAIPANTQLIDNGVHGFTAAPGDIEGTAEAIRRLFHETEFRKMSEAARKCVVNNYSLEQVLDRYEKVLNEVS